MKSRFVISLAMVAGMTYALFGCGGGGGGAPAPPAIPVTAASPVLVNYSTTVFANFSGTTVSNGTPVTFAIKTFTPYSSTGNPRFTSQTPVQNRVATARLHSNVRSDITVTATAGGFVGTSNVVNFIPQPDKVVAHIAINRSVTNFAALTLGMLNFNAGATFDNYSVTNALSSGFAMSIADPANLFNYAAWFVNPSTGTNVATGVTILDMKFRPTAPTVTGIPDIRIKDHTDSLLTFSVWSTATQPSTRNLTAIDYKVTTDYFRGSLKVLTK